MSVAITFDDVSVTDKRKIIVDADIITSSAADAEAARQAAEEAEASAESASGYAENASASAEAAGASAESAAASAEEAEQAVSGLTEDVEELQEQMQARAPVIISTASGTIATFVDGADDMPCKSVVCQIDAVQSGSGDPSPSNVRPITGWDGVNVNRCGVNLWDEVWENGAIDSTTGQNTVSPSVIRTKNYIPVLPGMKVYIKSPAQNSTNDGNLAGRFYSRDKSYMGVLVTMLVGREMTIPDNCYYIRFNAQVYYGDTYNHDISISYPSTDHEYHASSAVSHSLTFPQTVYGGWIDVVKGELHVDRVKWTPAATGVTAITMTGGKSGYRFGNTLLPVPQNKAKADKAISNVWKQSADWSTPNAICFSRTYNNIVNIIVDADYGITTTEAFNQWVVANDYYIVYYMKEELVYDLDPVTITTLLGSNNVYCNTGDSSVEYPADTKLYIQHLTQPDNDMIADSNIASGKFFMVGNSLYISTSAIASGETIVPGTNCNQINLATALNNIAEA